jgi:hypothetical protein
MITVKYLNFINENVETKTILGNLTDNISKVNSPLKDKKSKILKEISTVKTADGAVIEEGETYYTLFDSTTLKNGDKVKQIKVKVPFDKGYLVYTGDNTVTQNKIYGYLIVKDKAKIDILKGVELLKYHEKILQKGTEQASKPKTEPKAEVKQVVKKEETPVKSEVKTEAKPEVKKEETPVKPEEKPASKPEVTNKPI